MKTSILRRTPGVKGKSDSVTSQMVPENLKPKHATMVVTRKDVKNMKTGTITRLKGVPLRADVDYSRPTSGPSTRAIKISGGSGYRSTVKKKDSY